MDQFRIPHTIAMECGLSRADLCKVSDSTKSTEKTYCPSPNVPWEDALFAVRNAEREFARRRDAAGETPNVDLHPTSGRKTPREKDLEKLAREAASNPNAAAIRMIDQMH